MIFDIYKKILDSRSKDVEVDGHNGPISIMALTEEQADEYNSSTDDTKLAYAAVYGLQIDGVRAVDVNGVDKNVIECAFNHSDAPEQLIELIGEEVALLSGLEVPELFEEEQTDFVKDEDFHASPEQPEQLNGSGGI